MGLFADLHVHTTNSDGRFEISDIPDAADEAGVSVVAITDHDSIHPELPNVVNEIDGITIIRSIELRVEVPELGERVDLLGYGVERTPALVEETQRLQRDRETRSQRIIDAVEETLDISLDIEGEKGMGRPHIAREIEGHEELDFTYQQAFDELLCRDCPAYVSRDVTGFEKGVRLLSEACPVVGLAHPFRYNNPEDAIALTKHLDAIEGPYAYEDDVTVQPELVDEAVIENDLLVTGGTDAHGTVLGKDGLTESEFEPVRSKIPF